MLMLGPCPPQRRYDTRHEMLTQRALFALTPNGLTTPYRLAAQGHAELAFRDACRTSSAPSLLKVLRRYNINGRIQESEDQFKLRQDKSMRTVHNVCT